MRFTLTTAVRSIGGTAVRREQLAEVVVKIRQLGMNDVRGCVEDPIRARNCRCGGSHQMMVTISDASKRMPAALDDEGMNVYV